MPRLPDTSKNLFIKSFEGECEGCLFQKAPLVILINNNSTIIHSSPRLRLLVPKYSSRKERADMPS